MGSDLCGRAFRLGALIAGLLVPLGASAQEAELDPAVMLETFPTATRFGSATGTPPVYEAFGSDPTTGQEVLLGYLFLTSDWPPELKGYTSTIETLVGMDLTGKITGARVIEYYESLRSSRGDFLRGNSFERQFAGKDVRDAFRIRRDLFTISGATITAAVVARGIRNAARRVAMARLSGNSGEITPEEFENLSWPDLVMRGFGERLQGSQDGILQIELHLVPITDEEMGRVLLGDSYDRALRRLGNGADEKPLWMVGVDGPLAGLFRARSFTVERGSDTLTFARGDIALAGEPRSGKVSVQFRNVGLIAMDPSLDPKQNFTWHIDFGGRFPSFSLEHQGEPEVVVAAAPAPAPPPAAATEVEESPSAGATSEALPEVAPAAAESTELIEVQAVQAAPVFEPIPLDFADETEETVLQRTLETTSWVRFATLAIVLVFASVAFFAKVILLRWVTLAATLVILGFGGGGFLSVSHITAGIKVGLGVYLEDLPLLLLVVFTVVTTLLWGRVFCGFLCPFGALQDVLERIVPRKVRRKFPPPVHEGAVFLKYGVLGVILVPAITGSDASIFQYFEPFGTVFFFSRSTVLWAIAGAILVASAIIPRLYCRYLCPLGAALALASMLSPFRIKRVRQCHVCTVCEHSCPTGAIQRESIDFKECVRCNLCEVKLTEQAGVCGHDLEKVEQLIQIKHGRHHRHQHFPTTEVVSGD